jgi:hypothetical protein
MRSREGCLSMQRQTIVSALVGAAFAAILLPRAELPRAFAQQSGGGSDMFAVVGPGTVVGSSVLFVVDPNTSHLLVFEYRPGTRLELTAARDLRFDVQMPQYPTAPAKAPFPLVKDVEAALRELQAPAGGGQGGG